MGESFGITNENFYLEWKKKSFTIFALLIIHLVYPRFPQSLHNHCFQFLLGITVVPREIDDDAYARVLEVNSNMGNLKLEKKIVPPIKVVFSRLFFF